MNFAKSVASKAASSLLSFSTGRHCPICGWQGFCFLPSGIKNKRRFDAKCPVCGSLERHRLVFLTAQKFLEPTAKQKTLHIAPERCIGPWLESSSQDYLSIDLFSSAMRKMDIRNLEFDDNTFSLVWCSHVLEHVIEDTVAIAEIHRILDKDGVAVVQVPIWRQDTYENSDIVTEQDRLEHFYQRDHVRLYGMDIGNRFEEGGFAVTIVRSQDFGPESLIRNGLSFASTNEVFILRK